MLKLNLNRTFKAPVPVSFLDADGKAQDGEFSAHFTIVDRDKAKSDEYKDKELLDVVLCKVEDIQLTDDEGRILNEEDLLRAVIADPKLSRACAFAYWREIEKKPQRKT